MIFIKMNISNYCKFTFLLFGLGLSSNVIDFSILFWSNTSITFLISFSIFVIHVFVMLAFSILFIKSLFCSCSSISLSFGLFEVLYNVNIACFPRISSLRIESYKNLSEISSNFNFYIIL